MTYSKYSESPQRDVPMSADRLDHIENGLSEVGNTEMTAQEAEAGTSEAPMLVSAKVLHDEIARQIGEI